MIPFRCPVIILNTIDHLGKFDGKANEGFFVGYFLNSKAFKLFNSRTRIVKENLNIRFSESTPNVVRSGPDWLLDIDALTRTMNYEPIVAGTQSNGFAGTKASNNAGQARKETEPIKDYIFLPLWTTDPPFSKNPKISHNDESKPSSVDGKKVDEDPIKENEYNELPFDLNMHSLEDVSIFNFSNDDEDDGIVADMNNLDTTIQGNSDKLVAQGHTQEEAIDYYEVFSPVAKIEAIRLFLAYASFKDFVVYQMDVKSAFLYGKIEEEVYVCQPPEFKNSDFPDRVYKVKKALYELHQAPRAWHETLSTYILDNGFQKGKIDKTLFIKRYKGDILLVQVYVDDTIFDSTKKELCNAFESQDKYVAEILKKFGFTKVTTASAPMETQTPLFKDKNGKEVDVHMYRLMIGSLMYLTSSRPNIMFAVCACARYQVNPKVSHLYVVKVIFSARKKIVVANSIIEAEYVAALSCCGQFWSTAMDKTINGEAQLHARVDGKKIIITEASIRRDLQLADEEDEAIHKELGNSLVRAATIASSLEAEQDNGGGPRCQESMRDTTAQTRFESVSKHFNDSLLARVLDLEKKRQLKGRRIDAIDQGEDVTLVNVQDEAEMFDMNDLGVNAAQDSTATTTIELTLVQVLKALKTSKPKVKGIVIQEQEEPGKSTTTIISKQQSLDKGKGIIIEEHVKPKKKIKSGLMKKLLKGYKLNLMRKKDLQERELKKNKKKPILP
nr:retrovirus-related Pol polyprotein from transposon TNT 1-94 [Tanacetum cinerariifolium]